MWKDFFVVVSTFVLCTTIANHPVILYTFRSLPGHVNMYYFKLFSFWSLFLLLLIHSPCRNTLHVFLMCCNIRKGRLGNGMRRVLPKYVSLLVLHFLAHVHSSKPSLLEGSKILSKTDPYQFRSGWLSRSCSYDSRNALLVCQATIMLCPPWPSIPLRLKLVTCFLACFCTPKPAAILTIIISSM